MKTSAHVVRVEYTRATGFGDTELKRWERESLRREDWNFSELAKFPEEMIRVGWLFELDRELGSGNPPYHVAWELHEKKKRKAKLKAHIDGTHPLSIYERRFLLPEIQLDKNELRAEADLKRMSEEKPDMTLAEEKEYRKKDWVLDAVKLRKLDNLLISEMSAEDTNWKPSIPKESERILKSYHHHEFAEMSVPAMPGYTWVNGEESYHCTIHPLEIDWTLTETQLVEAFRNWLRNGEHSPFRPSYKRIAGSSKIGKRKKTGWLAWLRELAIYRISEAGFTRRQGLKMLGGATMSAANWEHAQARARKRIGDEKQRCEFFAWDQGQGFSNNWRDKFVKPFTSGDL